MKLLIGVFGAYCLALVLTSAGGYVSSINSNSPDGILSVGTVIASRGQSVEVPITLETDFPIRGIFLHLAYNGELLEYGLIRLGPKFSGSWHVFSNEPTPGNLRVVTLSFEGEDFVPDSDPVLIVTFNTSPYVPDGKIPISVGISNVVTSKLDSLDVATVDGSVTVVGSSWYLIPAA